MPPELLDCVAPRSVVSYTVGGYRYILPLRSVRAALRTHRLAAAILGDLDAADVLQQRLGPRTRVLRVYIDVAPTVIAHRLRAVGYTEEQIQLRVSRSQPSVAQHEQTPDGYFLTIDNSLGRDSYLTQIHRLATACLQQMGKAA